MKSRCLRTVKNHCKASKIHSSGDVRLEQGKGKVHKTDGQISEVFSLNFIISFIGSKSLINTVFSSGYKVFGAFFIWEKAGAQVPLNTAKHRLKSLQIEYYSSHKLCVPQSIGVLSWD